MATANHQQTDGQSERTIQTLEQNLRMFTSNAHNDWDDHLAQAEFAYNSTKVATGFSPFELVLGTQPNTPLSLSVHKPITQGSPSAREFINQHQDRFHMARDTLLEVKKHMTDQYNRHHRNVSFEVGDLVYVDSENLRPSSGVRNKLSPKFHGPYKIISRPSPLNYYLDLPPGSRVHPVFHVSKLRNHVYRDPGSFPLQEDPVAPPAPLVSDNMKYYEEEYEVERIVRHKNQPDGSVSYLVKWYGYPEDQSTWQTAEDLTNSPDVLREYHSTGGSQITEGVLEPTRQRHRNRTKRRLRSTKE